MSRSGAEIASAVNAKAIVTPTLSGNTARLLSVFRPDTSVLAVTPNEHAERVMQLYWGVNACRAPLADETEGMIQNAMKVASDTGMAGMSEKIVLVAGLPLHSPNMVNTVRVLILGTILARSSSGGFANPSLVRVRGRIVHAVTPHEAREKIMLMGGDILVCRTLTKDYIPIVRIVKGVICEEISEVTDVNLCDTNPNLVWLTHIRHATEKLESGLAVTLDAEQLLVYEGSI
jgi:pyruvate kinase